MNSFSTLPFENRVSGSLASSAVTPFSGSDMQFAAPPTQLVTHEPWPGVVVCQLTPTASLRLSKMRPSSPRIASMPVPPDDQSAPQPRMTVSFCASPKTMSAPQPE